MKKRLRVKYYQYTDMAFGLGMEIVNDYYPLDPFPLIKNINDAIECYNIAKYLDDTHFSPTYIQKDLLPKYRNYSSLLKKASMKYFSSLNAKTFIDVTKTLEPRYTDDYLYLIEKTGVYKTINGADLLTVLNEKSIILHEILENQKLTKHFSAEIKFYFDNHVDSAEELIRFADSQKNRSIKTFYIPDDVLKERDTYLLNYVNSNNPNFNYLQMMVDIRFQPLLPPKIKLNANKKIKELIQQLFSTSGTLSTEIKVEFNPNQKEEEKKVINGCKLINYSYSLKWLKENLDYPTILNNFIYLFEFTDSCGRIEGVFNEFDSGIFERVSFSNNTEFYNTNRWFILNSDIELITLNLYLPFLKTNGILLENVIRWFFDTYLPTEFHVIGFKCVLASENTKFSEKCQFIASFFDSLFKQYFYYVTDKYIDHELLAIDSKPLMIQDLPSLLNKKYCYGIGVEYHNIVHLLFSDQSTLAYLKRINKTYNSFAALITLEKVTKEEYDRYHQSIIDYLIENNILYIKDGILAFKDIISVSILFELYRKQYISYWHLLPFQREKVEELADKGFIEFSSKFLSKEESDYFNYFMNNHFSNGLQIRDLYAHGNAQIIDDENVHYKNYLILMKLLILFIIKINDELYLYDTMETGIEK